MPGLWPLVPQEQAGVAQPRSQFTEDCQASGVMGPTVLDLGGPTRHGDAGEERKPICLQDSLLSSPETLKTLGWNLSWGLLKFKSQRLGRWAWTYRASLRTEGSSGPRGTLTRGTHLYPTHIHKVPHIPKAGIEGAAHPHHLTPQPAQQSLHIAKGYAKTTMSHPLSLLNLSGCIPHSPSFSMGLSTSVQTNTESSSSSYLPY